MTMSSNTAVDAKAELMQAEFTSRYRLVAEEKASGATYTPKGLADFVAEQIVQAAGLGRGRGRVRVLDPAVGEGELLSSLLERLPASRRVEVYGFDTDESAVKHTEARLRAEHPKASISLEVGDFLGFVLEKCGAGMLGGLFEACNPKAYDLIIANPPYVRTQIMGAAHAQTLAKQFGLTGRVDLYHAFILGMSKVLRPRGVAGIIVSNRFMTTKAGASVRRAIRELLNLRHVWDLGDTKVFNAAVLPAVLLAEGRNGGERSKVDFTSVYETQDRATFHADSVIDALAEDGIVAVPDGRRFSVRQGTLNDSGGLAEIWRIATAEADAWLATVDSQTWRRFGDIGKVRVGVKTCADKVFIRVDWGDEGERPELLRPLMTHHVARRFRADASNQQRFILYPHDSRGGKRRVVDLEAYPRSKSYLEDHRARLEGRKYVLEAGRRWYEVWVPQDPEAWDRPKLVFRDISERPCFWIDRHGAVVNGDCYWMICDRDEGEDVLWLAAAVGNSTFIESFYDHRFNNKLYAGRRRFITQYVEKFPLPDPCTPVGKAIIERAKWMYDATDDEKRGPIEKELNGLVWEAFGLDVEEVGR